MEPPNYALPSSNMDEPWIYDELVIKSKHRVVQAWRRSIVMARGKEDEFEGGGAKMGRVSNLGEP